MARTQELGLFSASGQRLQPRDVRGRFLRVRYSAERLKILAKARAMRADQNMPASPWLDPMGEQS